MSRRPSSPSPTRSDRLGGLARYARKAWRRRPLEVETPAEGHDLDQVTLALCLLVHDEDDPSLLERSLRSVRPILDYWVVVDTGSGSNGELAEQLLSPVPGERHRRDWVDFGHNRSEAAAFAHGKADYLLIWEPAFTLVRRSALPLLTGDAYRLPRVDGSDDVARLLRGSRAWWFEGTTNEVPATNGRHLTAALDALCVRVDPNPEIRTARLQRELGVLERDFHDGRDEKRTAMRLAETLAALGRSAEAIEWYRRRTDLGDADEETFVANLRQGRLLAPQDFGAAVPVLLRAWQRRPHRAEPLHELARGYREMDLADLASLFANLGLELPVPSDHTVERWIYDWGLTFERGWSSSRLGRYQEAEADLRPMLDDARVPEDFKELAASWLRTVAEGLKPTDSALGSVVPDPLVPTLSALIPGARSGRIDLNLDDRWRTFNPSITSDGDGFAMIVRSENVRFDRGKLRFDEEAHRNFNYLVRLDGSLAVLSVEPLDDDPERFLPHPARVTGFMDLRLFALDGRWCASGSSWQLSPGRESSEPAFVELEWPQVTAVHRLVGPDPGRREKNWMPFVHRGELHYVYSCGPTVIFRYDPATERVVPAARSAAPDFAMAFRGGSQGVPLADGGYLFVIHEMYHRGGIRSYLHRFIRIGPDLALDAVSRPFTLTDEVREFCAGAAVHGNELVLSFGVRHTESWLMALPLSDALALLEPVFR